MTLELHDTATFNGSIAADGTEQLAVKTNKADVVEVLVDGGASGTAPTSYDLVVEYYSTAADDWMQVDSVTGVTSFAPSVEESARGQQYRITLTNATAGPETYRISLEAFNEV